MSPLVSVGSDTDPMYRVLSRPMCSITEMAKTWSKEHAFSAGHLTSATSGHTPERSEAVRGDVSIKHIFEY